MSDHAGRPGASSTPIRRALCLLGGLLGVTGSACGPAGADTIELATPAGPVPALVVQRHPPDPGGSGTRTEARPALLLGLHGYGSDERQVASMLGVKPDFPHVYLAPRGFHWVEGGGFAWFPITMRDGRPAVDGAALSEAIQRFAELRDAAVDASGADPKRVFVIGYSQGAALSITLAATRPGMANGFAAFAGAVPDPVWGLVEPASTHTGRRLLIGHGTLDGFTPEAVIRRDADRLRSLGLSVDLHVDDIPHVVSNAQRRRLLEWLER